MEELILKDLPTVDYMLRTTWNTVVKAYNTEAANYDFTMVMGFALVSIDPVEGISSTSLGPRMGMEPTSLSRTLKNLEQLDLIERHPNPQDGRGVIIKLTELGLQHRSIAKEVIVTFNNTIVKHFEREKILAFFEVCQEIQRLADENKIFNK